MPTAARIDCHVHLDPIGGLARPSPQRGPSAAMLRDYVTEQNLALVWGIFERDETVRKLSGVAPILPLYWVREPDRPQEISSLANGVKLHPYRDGWAISRQHLEPTLDRLPPQSIVLIHCDDRSSTTTRDSRPRLIDPIATAYPELNFVVGHSGSYAPDSRKQAYAKPVDPATTRELVSEAISVANGLDNVYLETSVLRSRIKAELLAEGGRVDRLLIGTDFPIGYDVGMPDYSRDLGMLESLGLRAQTLAENACRLTLLAGCELEPSEDRDHVD